MLKLYILGCVVLGAAFAYKQQVYNNNEYPKTYNEAPCLYEGGICVVADDCPEGALSESSGLCPLQQPQGVECCHGIPKSEKSCRSNGGECMSISYRCPEDLTYKKAIDCKQDEKCCILVQ